MWQLCVVLIRSLAFGIYSTHLTSRRAKSKTKKQGFKFASSGKFNSSSVLTVRLCDVCS